MMLMIDPRLLLRNPPEPPCAGNTLPDNWRYGVVKRNAAWRKHRLESPCPSHHCSSQVFCTLVSVQKSHARCMRACAPSSSLFVNAQRPTANIVAKCRRAWHCWNRMNWCWRAITERDRRREVRGARGECVAEIQAIDSEAERRRVVSVSGGLVAVQQRHVATVECHYMLPSFKMRHDMRQVTTSRPLVACGRPRPCLRFACCIPRGMRWQTARR